MNRLIIILTLASACSLISATSHSAPLGPGFTYQGHLGQNGESVNGPIHLRFSLWDAAGVGQPPIGGTQIGASQLVTDVPVAEGVFNVLLNGAGEFGPNAFNGEARWLQIEVCADPGCAGLNILSPRQPLTGTPYAINATSAPWTGLTGMPAGFADGIDNIGDPVWPANGANISYTTGAVGIGTDVPTRLLEVSDTGLFVTRFTGFHENAGVVEFRSGSSGHTWEFGVSGAVPPIIGSPAGTAYFYRQTSNFPNIMMLPDNSVAIGTPDTNFVRLQVYDAEVSSNGAAWFESINSDGVRGLARGPDKIGVYGYNSPGGVGVVGQGRTGVFGSSFVPGGVGVEGLGGDGVALAGRFNGDVDVTGNVLKAGGGTKIDHPLDPANKYLLHNSVESPEMTNMYYGTITTGATGERTVTLPDYFEALNRDFHYQLTVIGGFAQAVVAREIDHNTFEIKTDKPNIKVSWQVTGVRNDLYAQKHPNEVEKLKSESERGKYLIPELYGQPKEKGIHYRPELERPTEAVSKGE